MDIRQQLILILYIFHAIMLLGKTIKINRKRQRMNGKVLQSEMDILRCVMGFIQLKEEIFQSKSTKDLLTIIFLKHMQEFMVKFQIHLTKKVDWCYTTLKLWFKNYQMKKTFCLVALNITWILCQLWFKVCTI